MCGPFKDSAVSALVEAGVVPATTAPGYLFFSSALAQFCLYLFMILVFLNMREESSILQETREAQNTLYNDELAVLNEKLNKLEVKA